MNAHSNINTYAPRKYAFCVGQWYKHTNTPTSIAIHTHKHQHISSRTFCVAPQTRSIAAQNRVLNPKLHPTVAKEYMKWPKRKTHEIHSCRRRHSRCIAHCVQPFQSESHPKPPPTKQFAHNTARRNATTVRRVVRCLYADDSIHIECNRCPNMYKGHPPDPQRKGDRERERIHEESAKPVQ